ncbi:MAG: WbqC family protein [Desulfoprunum sp.]|nr:WbqC family protein [Desulfoprunum sp.]
MNVVISQSMLFPWVGMLEQVSLADCFVHYDDVQFSKGSFVNRVQIKTAKGVRWMTVPLKNRSLGQSIDEVEFAPVSSWRDNHIELLKKSFEGARFAEDALEIASNVYSIEYPNIGSLARASLLSLIKYFSLDKSKSFIDVKELGIEGSSSLRVLEIVKRLGGTTYITGLGALKYLDHTLFEKHGISVRYMKYRCCPYSQLHGEFTPYVSGLDLIANYGKEGIRYICSEAVDWRRLVNESH